MSNTKFYRNYVLTIQTSDGEYIDIKYPFTCEFSCQRNIFMSANTANFKIYNLSKFTRQNIYKDKFNTLEVRNIIFKVQYLYLGNSQELITIDNSLNGYKNIYDNTNNVKNDLNTLFIGEVRQCHSYRQGVDIITEIDCYEGTFARQNSTSSFNATEGTSFADIFKNIYGDLSNNNINRFEISESFSQIKLKRDRAFYGNSFNLLKNLSRDNFYIDNMVAYIMDLPEYFSIFENDYIINASSGLLDAPQRNETYFILNVILEPKFKIGQVVDLYSEINPFMNGKRKIVGLEHSGIISPVENGKCTTKVWLHYGISPLLEARSIVYVK